MSRGRSVLIDLVLLLGFVVLLENPSVNVHGFALMGPYSDWMDPTNSYRMGWDVGGPVNITERYRWNVPVVTYGFDQSFLDYFGTNGVNAVGQAFQVLIDLPPASAIVLTNYPAAALRVNYQAVAQRLFDLKTATLSLLVEQLGLAEPQRSIFVLRQWSPVFTNLNSEANWPSWVIPDFILESNYDPETLALSHYVNGNLFTGEVVVDYGPLTPSPYLAWVQTFLVDPLQSFYTATADFRGLLRPVLDVYPNNASTYAGYFFDRLTQDDVGGLRYLLSTNNVSMEVLLPDVRGVGTNASSFVDLASRPGIDKITFVRQPYDSLLGRFFVPFTNQFMDTFFTNGIVQHQQLERVTTEPDFLFSAVAASETNNRAPFFIRTGVAHWWNSAAAAGAVGPGVIQPPVQIAFNQLGPCVQTDDQTLSKYGLMTVANLQWASFDSSTNPPIVYPSGLVTGPTNAFVVHQWLFDSYKTNFGNYEAVRWVTPVPLGGQALLQTSTNLTDWISLGALVNQGAPLNWQHFYSVPQRYFRVVPQ